MSVKVSVSDVEIVPTVQQEIRNSVEPTPGCSSWVNPDELSEAECSGEILVDRSMIDTSATDDRSDDFACFALASVDDLSYEEALNGPESKFWKVAIDEELKAMEVKDVWYPVSESSVKGENYSKVDSKWVLKKKINSNGGVKYKARLVLRGFKDNHYYELDEIYAPTPNQPIIRSMLNLAVVNRWQLRQLDVSTAFLNGDINRNIMFNPPKGTNERSGIVYVLKRSLYGLKTSPKSWNAKLNSYLLSLGFTRSKVDPCVYFDSENPLRCVFVVYVDDFLITGCDVRLIDWLVKRLNERFGIRDLEQCKKFIGMEIERSENQLEIHQNTYIQQLVNDYGLANSNSISTPIEPNLKITNLKLDKNFETKVRGLLGSLSYIARGTRPDIAFAVNFLSRYQHLANKELFEYSKRILRYLRSTLNVKITYVVPEYVDRHSVRVFVDSDFAGDSLDRKSTSGIFVLHYGNVIDWCVKKQNCVSLSSCEAEYVALSASGKEVLAWRNLFVELGVRIDTIPVYCDSNAAIAVANTVESKRTRHIDVSYHHVRDLISKNIIYLQKVSSADQLADLLTKATTHTVFERLCNTLYRA